MFEFYSHRKSTEELKAYLSSHEPEVRDLDEESRFLLTTIIKEKRLKKQFLKKAEPKEKEDNDMCEAIQGMIDEGKAEGKAEAVLILLKQKGELSSDTENRIRQEKDTDTLTKWLLLAANTESISGFELAMN